MNSTSSASGSAPPTTLRGALRRMLTLIALTTAVTTLLAVILGLLVDGTAGLWGALLGGAIGVFFCLTTVVTMLVSEGRSPQFLAIAVLGGWLAKMAVIIALLAVLANFTFYNRYVFVATMMVIVLASLVIEMQVVRGARIPVTQDVPKAQGPQGSAEGE
ncbi:hypothetical protein [Serinibacter salmoneus]|uniref:ATP synthase protein I n=1 Tax=Serinibacter salmoneus TaxID=556530 RepID=A0A2A9D212_9MICO|nr:hypothetical protein [Serinibacter salmoneus]PFG20295.1 hypothetical protein ATL40_1892 [Serinibacter salmoneus]